MPKEFWDNYAHEFYGNYWEYCRELAIEHGLPYSDRQLREIFEELIADHAAGSTLRGRSGISVRGLDKRELFEDGRGSSLIAGSAASALGWHSSSHVTTELTAAAATPISF